jgi:hypothetical protein
VPSRLRPNAVRRCCLLERDCIGEVIVRAFPSRADVDTTKIGGGDWFARALNMPLNTCDEWEVNDIPKRIRISQGSRGSRLSWSP